MKAWMNIRKLWKIFSAFLAEPKIPYLAFKKEVRHLFLSFLFPLAIICTTPNKVGRGIQCCILFTNLTKFLIFDVLATLEVKHH